MSKMPAPQIDDVGFWVDEDIWGHRLYDEQTPRLTLLEFLGIYDYFYKKDPESCLVEPLNDKGVSELVYRTHRRLHLRNILFNNPYVSATLERTNLSEEQKWHYWLVKIHNYGAVQYQRDGQEVKNFERLEENAFEVDPERAKSICEFYYLKSRFEKFSDFAAVVEFLRVNAFEVDTNKRWSSKYVFPFGPDCFFDDLKVEVKKDKDDKSIHTVTSGSDRRFFGRTGELLYLMLCRSGQTTALNEGLNGLIFNREKNQWNQLLCVLQPFGADGNKLDSTLLKNQHPTSHKISPPYLPEQSLPDFMCLGKDWGNLFDCQMPNYDVIPHLERITGLHLVRYFLNRSCEVLGGEKTEMVLEILAPRKTKIRDLASQSYYHNNSLSQRALKSFIYNRLQTEAWSSAVASGSGEQAFSVLKSTFKWKADPEKYSDSPNKVLQSFIDDVTYRHKGHLHKTHNVYSKSIGLSSTRGSRRTRYTPTDDLLETLVLATVPQRLEFQSFLKELYRKYAIVIGDQQAQSLIDSNRADKEDFSRNAERLEQRLLSIGLLQRLSDACAYVINPYTGKVKV